MPGFLACPDDICAQAVLAAIVRAAANKEGTEAIDLLPAPAELLDGVAQSAVPSFQNACRLISSAVVRHHSEARKTGLADFRGSKVPWVPQ